MVDFRTPSFLNEALAEVRIAWFLPGEPVEPDKKPPKFKINGFTVKICLTLLYGLTEIPVLRF